MSFLINYVTRNVVASLVSKFAEDFFDGIDRDHLQLSLAAGEVTLGRVRVKSAFLASLNTPVTVLSASVEGVRIKVPLANPLSGGWEVDLLGLTVHAKPRESRRPFPETADAARERRRKASKTLQKAFEAKKHILSALNGNHGKVATILRNLRLQLSDTTLLLHHHIGEAAPSLRLHIGSLDIFSVGSDEWTPTDAPDDASSAAFRKRLHLQGLRLTAADVRKEREEAARQRERTTARKSGGMGLLEAIISPFWGSQQSEAAGAGGSSGRHADPASPGGGGGGGGGGDAGTPWSRREEAIREAMSEEGGPPHGSLLHVTQVDVRANLRSHPDVDASAQVLLGRVRSCLPLEFLRAPGCARGPGRYCNACGGCKGDVCLTTAVQRSLRKMSQRPVRPYQHRIEPDQRVYWVKSMWQYATRCVILNQKHSFTSASRYQSYKVVAGKAWVIADYKRLKVKQIRGTLTQEESRMLQEYEYNLPKALLMQSWTEVLQETSQVQGWFGSWSRSGPSYAFPKLRYRVSITVGQALDAPHPDGGQQGDSSTGSAAPPQVRVVLLSRSRGRRSGGRGSRRGGGEAPATPPPPPEAGDGGDGVPWDTASACSAGSTSAVSSLDHSPSRADFTSPGPSPLPSPSSITTSHCSPGGREESQKAALLRSHAALLQGSRDTAIPAAAGGLRGRCHGVASPSPAPPTAAPASPPPPPAQEGPLEEEAAVLSVGRVEAGVYFASGSGSGSGDSGDPLPDISFIDESSNKLVRLIGLNGMLAANVSGDSEVHATAEAKLDPKGNLVIDSLGKTCDIPWDSRPFVFASLRRLCAEEGIRCALPRKTLSSKISVSAVSLSFCDPEKPGAPRRQIAHIKDADNALYLRRVTEDRVKLATADCDIPGTPEEPAASPYGGYFTPLGGGDQAGAWDSALDFDDTSRRVVEGAGGIGPSDPPRGDGGPFVLYETVRKATLGAVAPVSLEIDIAFLQLLASLKPPPICPLGERSAFQPDPSSTPKSSNWMSHPIAGAPCDFPFIRQVGPASGVTASTPRMVVSNTPPHLFKAEGLYVVYGTHNGYPMWRSSCGGVCAGGAPCELCTRARLFSSVGGHWMVGPPGGIPKSEGWLLSGCTHRGVLPCDLGTAWLEPRDGSWGHSMASVCHGDSGAAAAWGGEEEEGAASDSVSPSGSDGRGAEGRLATEGDSDCSSSGGNTSGDSGGTPDTPDAPPQPRGRRQRRSRDVATPAIHSQLSLRSILGEQQHDQQQRVADVVDGVLGGGASPAPDSDSGDECDLMSSFSTSGFPSSVGGSAHGAGAAQQQHFHHQAQQQPQHHAPPLADPSSDVAAPEGAPLAIPPPMTGDAMFGRVHFYTRPPTLSASGRLHAGGVGDVVTMERGPSGKLLVAVNGRGTTSPDVLRVILGGSPRVDLLGYVPSKLKAGARSLELIRGGRLALPFTNLPKLLGEIRFIADRCGVPHRIPNSLQAVPEHKLTRPEGLSATKDGTLFIADACNHRVLRWVPGCCSGTVVAGGHGAGSGRRQLNFPSGVCVAPAAQLLIADTHNHRVQRYHVDTEDAPTTVAGRKGKGSSPSHLCYPTAVEVGPDGKMYICDAGNNRVVTWRIGDDKLERVIAGSLQGSRGCSEKLLDTPKGIFVTRDCAVYIADTLNHRIVRCDYGTKTLKVVAGSGEPGSLAHQLCKPHAVAVKADGSLLIADTGNDRVQLWSAGKHAGITVRYDMRSPRGLCLAPTEKVYVADTLNNVTYLCTPPFTTVNVTGLHDEWHELSPLFEDPFVFRGERRKTIYECSPLCRGSDAWFSKTVNTEKLLDLLLTAFLQRPATRSVLEATGDSPIRFVTNDDSAWGVGDNGRGTNAYGLTLVKVREYLKRPSLCVSYRLWKGAVLRFPLVRPSTPEKEWVAVVRASEVHLPGAASEALDSPPGQVPFSLPVSDGASDFYLRLSNASLWMEARGADGVVLTAKDIQRLWRQHGRTSAFDMSSHATVAEAVGQEALGQQCPVMSRSDVALHFQRTKDHSDLSTYWTAIGTEITPAKASHAVVINFNPTGLQLFTHFLKEVGAWAGNMFRTPSAAEYRSGVGEWTIGGPSFVVQGMGREWCRPPRLRFQPHTVVVEKEKLSFQDRWVMRFFREEGDSTVWPCGTSNTRDRARYGETCIDPAGIVLLSEEMDLHDNLVETLQPDLSALPKLRECVDALQKICQPPGASSGLNERPPRFLWEHVCAPSAALSDPDLPNLLPRASIHNLRKALQSANGVPSPDEAYNILVAVNTALSPLFRTSYAIVWSVRAGIRGSQPLGVGDRVRVKQHSNSPWEYGFVTAVQPQRGSSVGGVNTGSAGATSPGGWGGGGVEAGVGAVEYLVALADEDGSPREGAEGRVYPITERNEEGALCIMRHRRRHEAQKLLRILKAKVLDNSDRTRQYGSNSSVHPHVLPAQQIWPEKHGQLDTDGFPFSSFFKSHMYVSIPMCEVKLCDLSCTTLFLFQMQGFFYEMSDGFYDRVLDVGAKEFVIWERRTRVNWGDSRARKRIVELSSLGPLSDRSMGQHLGNQQQQQQQQGPRKNSSSRSNPLTGKPSLRLSQRLASQPQGISGMALRTSLSTVSVASSGGGGGGGGGGADPIPFVDTEGAATDEDDDMESEELYHRHGEHHHHHRQHSHHRRRSGKHHHASHRGGAKEWRLKKLWQSLGDECAQKSLGKTFLFDDPVSQAPHCFHRVLRCTSQAGCLNRRSPATMSPTCGWSPDHPFHPLVGKHPQKWFHPTEETDAPLALYVTYIQSKSGRSLWGTSHGMTGFLTSVHLGDLKVDIDRAVLPDTVYKYNIWMDPLSGYPEAFCAFKWPGYESIPSGCPPVSSRSNLEVRFDSAAVTAGVGGVAGYHAAFSLTIAPPGGLLHWLTGSQGFMKALDVKIGRVEVLAIYSETGSTIFWLKAPNRHWAAEATYASECDADGVVKTAITGFVGVVCGAYSSGVVGQLMALYPNKAIRAVNSSYIRNRYAAPLIDGSMKDEPDDKRYTPSGMVRYPCCACDTLNHWRARCLAGGMPVGPTPLPPTLEVSVSILKVTLFAPYREPLPPPYPKQQGKAGQAVAPTGSAGLDNVSEETVGSVRPKEGRDAPRSLLRGARGPPPQPPTGRRRGSAPPAPSSSFSSSCASGGKQQHQHHRGSPPPAAHNSSALVVALDGLSYRGTESSGTLSGLSDQDAALSITFTKDDEVARTAGPTVAESILFRASFEKADCLTEVSLSINEVMGGVRIAPIYLRRAMAAVRFALEIPPGMVPFHEIRPEDYIEGEHDYSLLRLGELLSDSADASIPGIGHYVPSPRADPGSLSFSALEGLRLPESQTQNSPNASGGGGGGDGADEAASPPHSVEKKRKPRKGPPQMWAVSFRAPSVLIDAVAPDGEGDARHTSLLKLQLANIDMQATSKDPGFDGLPPAIPTGDDGSGAERVGGDPHLTLEIRQIGALLTSDQVRMTSPILSYNWTARQSSSGRDGGGGGGGAPIAQSLPSSSGGGAAGGGGGGGGGGSFRPARPPVAPPAHAPQLPQAAVAVSSTSGPPFDSVDASLAGSLRGTTTLPRASRRKGSTAGPPAEDPPTFPSHRRGGAGVGSGSDSSLESAYDDLLRSDVPTVARGATTQPHRFQRVGSGAGVVRSLSGTEMERGSDTLWGLNDPALEGFESALEPPLLCYNDYGGCTEEGVQGCRRTVSADLHPIHASVSASLLQRCIQVWSGRGAEVDDEETASSLASSTRTAPKGGPRGAAAAPSSAASSPLRSNPLKRSLAEAEVNRRRVTPVLSGTVAREGDPLVRISEEEFEWPISATDVSLAGHGLGDRWVVAPHGVWSAAGGAKEVSVYIRPARYLILSLTDRGLAGADRGDAPPASEGVWSQPLILQCLVKAVFCDTLFAVSGFDAELQRTSISGGVASVSLVTDIVHRFMMLPFGSSVVFGQNCTLLPDRAASRDPSSEINFAPIRILPCTITAQDSDAPTEPSFVEAFLTSGFSAEISRAPFRFTVEERWQAEKHFALSADVSLSCVVPREGAAAIDFSISDAGITSHRRAGATGAAVASSAEGASRHGSLGRKKPVNSPPFSYSSVPAGSSPASLSGGVNGVSVGVGVAHQSSHVMRVCPLSLCIKREPHGEMFEATARVLGKALSLPSTRPGEAPPAASTTPSNSDPTASERWRGVSAVESPVWCLVQLSSHDTLDVRSLLKAFAGVSGGGSEMLSPKAEKMKIAQEALSRGKQKRIRAVELQQQQQQQRQRQQQQQQQQQRVQGASDPPSHEEEPSYLTAALIKQHEGYSRRRSRVAEPSPAMCRFDIQAELGRIEVVLISGRHGFNTERLRWRCDHTQLSGSATLPMSQSCVMDTSALTADLTYTFESRAEVHNVTCGHWDLLLNMGQEFTLLREKVESTGEYTQSIRAAPWARDGPPEGDAGGGADGTPLATSITISAETLVNLTTTLRDMTGPPPGGSHRRNGAAEHAPYSSQTSTHYTVRNETGIPLRLIGADPSDTLSLPGRFQSRVRLDEQSVSRMSGERGRISLVARVGEETPSASSRPAGGEGGGGGGAGGAAAAQGGGGRGGASPRGSISPRSTLYRRSEKSYIVATRSSRDVFRVKKLGAQRLFETICATGCPLPYCVMHTSVRGGVLQTTIRSAVVLRNEFDFPLAVRLHHPMHAAMRNIAPDDVDVAPIVILPPAGPQEGNTAAVPMLYVTKGTSFDIRPLCALLNDPEEESGARGRMRQAREEGSLPHLNEEARSELACLRWSNPVSQRDSLPGVPLYVLNKPFAVKGDAGSRNRRVTVRCDVSKFPIPSQAEAARIARHTLSGGCFMSAVYRPTWKPAELAAGGSEAELQTHDLEITIRPTVSVTNLLPFPLQYNMGPLETDATPRDPMRNGELRHPPQVQLLLTELKKNIFTDTWAEGVEEAIQSVLEDRELGPTLEQVFEDSDWDAQRRKFRTPPTKGFVDSLCEAVAVASNPRVILPGRTAALLSVAPEQDSVMHFQIHGPVMQLTSTLQVPKWPASESVDYTVQIAPEAKSVASSSQKVFVTHEASPHANVVLEVWSPIWLVSQLSKECCSHLAVMRSGGKVVARGDELLTQGTRGLQHGQACVFSPPSFLGKPKNAKIQVAVDQSDFSTPFRCGEVGTDNLLCVHRDKEGKSLKVTPISVTTSAAPGNFARSRMVTFRDRYLAFNHLPVTLELRVAHFGRHSHVTTLLPHVSTPIAWGSNEVTKIAALTILRRSDGAMPNLQVSIAGTDKWSAEFPVTMLSGRTKLLGEAGEFRECVNIHSSIQSFVTFIEFSPSLVPFLQVCNSTTWPAQVWQQPLEKDTLEREVDITECTPMTTIDCWLNELHVTPPLRIKLLYGRGSEMVVEIDVKRLNARNGCIKYIASPVDCSFEVSIRLGSRGMCADIIPVHAVAAFHIRVASAGNLIGRDATLCGRATSDPYCILQVDGRGPKQQDSKTSVIETTTDPVWHERDWKTFPIYLHESTLSVTVWDEDVVMSDDFLGQITVPLNRDTLGLQGRRRFELQSRPGAKDWDMVRHHRREDFGHIILEYQFTTPGEKPNMPDDPPLLDTVHAEWPLIVQISSSFQISVCAEVAGHLREIIFIEIGGINMVMVQEPDGVYSGNLDVGLLQVDNCMGHADFHVIFGSTQQGTRPALRISGARMSHKRSRGFTADYLGVFLHPIRLTLGDTDLLSLIAGFALVSKTLFTEDLGYRELARLFATMPEPSGSPASQHLHFSIGEVFFHKVRPEVTWLGLGGRGASSRRELPSLLQSWGIAFLSIDAAKVTLPDFRRTNLLARPRELRTMLQLHYLPALLRASVVLLSASAVGNPYAFLSSIYNGVEALISEILNSYQDDLKSVGKGVIRGAIALVGNVVVAFLGLLSALCRLFGQLFGFIDSLAGSELYQARHRIEIRVRRPRGLLQGLKDGCFRLADGVYYGATGVFTAPYDGALRGGVVGALGGVCTGVTGLVAKPVQGVFDLLETVCEGGIASINGPVRSLRRRPPRVVVSGILTPYSRRRSEVYAMLCSLNISSRNVRLRLAEEYYAFHSEGLVDGSFYVITTHRVVHMVSGSGPEIVHQRWSVDLVCITRVVLSGPAVLLLYHGKSSKKKKLVLRAAGDVMSFAHALLDAPLCAAGEVEMPASGVTPNLSHVIDMWDAGTNGRMQADEDLGSGAEGGTPGRIVRHSERFAQESRVVHEVLHSGDNFTLTERLRRMMELLAQKR